MRKIAFFLSALIFCWLSLFSCKKKKYTCKFYYDYIRPTGVAFIGFSKSELDTIIVKKYAGFTNFNHFLSSDTLRLANNQMWTVNDTVFRQPDSTHIYYFWALDSNVDYVVLLPAANDSFSITGTSGGPSYFLYQEEEPCGGMSREEVRPLQNIHVNGEPVNPLEMNFDPTARYVFLEK